MTGLERRILHVVLLGPVTGALAGTVQALAAVAVWVSFGQPDFYFRSGWSSARMNLTVMFIGGGLVGLHFGAFVFFFEYLARRTIRVGWFVTVLVSASFGISAIYVYFEFCRQRLFDVLFFQQGLALVLGLLLAPLLSKKSPSNHSLQ